MPLDRLLLIVFVALAAAGATIWLAAIVSVSLTLPFGALALLPALVVGYVAWRVIADRLRNAEDDHYDRME